MGTNMQVKISNNSEHACKYDKNVERGMFMALRDLIMMENGIIHDPVGAFFVLSSGYRIHKQRNGDGAVFDPDGAEIFLTAGHIDDLFRAVGVRMRQLSRRRSR